VRAAASPRAVAVTLIATATLATPAVASHTPAKPFEAAYAGQTPGGPEGILLESGQTRSVFFRAENLGSRTWEPGGVHLGTVSKNYAADGSTTVDTPSFFKADDWLAPTRPTALDEPTVGPHGIGTFTFSVHAPSGLTAAETRDEGFAPVADYPPPDGDWMTDPFWRAWLRFRVVPADDPTVRLTSVPSSVKRGEPLDVEADATDNAGVARVVFSVRGAPSVTDATAPYAARLDTSGLETGANVVSAEAFDVIERRDRDAGQVTVTTTSSQGSGSGGGTGGNDPGGTPGGAGGGTSPGGADRKRLDSTAIIRARPAGRRGLRVDSLKVTAPRGSRISVRCAPKRCRPITVRRTRRAQTLLRFRTRRALPVGTRILVRVTKPGTIGEETTFTVVRGDVSKRERALS
jgi:uncharacterized membrane protein YgcG